VDDALRRAPSGPEELWRLYHGDVLHLVRRTRMRDGSPAIPVQDAEDVASEIMTRLLERDVIGMFDPDRVFTYGGREVPARFRTFLKSVVDQYILGQRDKLGRHSKREALVCDQPVSEDGASWAEVFGPSAEDSHDDLAAAEWLRQAREVLAREGGPASSRGKRDMLALFDELAVQVGRDGVISRDRLCDRFGIAPGTASAWLARMRKILRAEAASGVVLELPVECAVTVAQARQAAAVLRSVTGQPMVRQPLAKAGSPLQFMDYHAIARAERAAYPGLEIPRADHHGPAPHVLSAVIHYLERVIGEAEKTALPAW
jgi:DNA-directed RNA polymerase specialized sigma24 family protein